MDFIIGAVLALGVALSASWVGFDRDRAFYPTIMIVIASYYGLFALMGKAPQALLPEGIAMALFIGAAVIGFRGSLWWVVGALAAHGVFDWIHGGFIVNPGVPVWWPAFCSSYDVVAALYLAWMLRRRQAVA